jgi:uncharacterized protein YndB with AHSA1/START domain
MTSHPKFVFSADTTNGTLTIGREFAAKRQLVWDCYTKSELLNQWFAPKPLTTKTKSMDFREGGHWHYAMMDPSGAEYWGLFNYHEIKPIDRYTALDGFCDAEGKLNPAMPRSNWEVTFADMQDRTRVQTIVTYASSADLEKVMQMGMQDGMTSTLERLDELLATLS